ncbi:MAG: M48 family metalloprotease [Euryarchaeota archaeon]|nr:M48 family metalloprotease [Euryarchaeota archaeon]
MSVAIWKLRLRLWLSVTLLFALLYAFFVGVGFLAFRTATGFLGFALAITLLMVFIQYMLGPVIVGWSMRVRRVTEQEEPRLHAIVDELAREAKMPKPRVGVSEVPIPNAFAYGRTRRGARICVTRELMGRLDEKELKGVLGHELSHILHRDVVLITLLSVIPMVLYHIYISLFWGSLFGGRSRDRGAAMAVAMGAFLFYFISQLFVLYASRLRELYADQGAVRLTGERAPLASALFKIVYGTSRHRPEDLKKVEGMRALFASDPATARHDAVDLRSFDLNRDGRIDESELDMMARENIRIGRAQRMMEMFSTHPNMVKRIKALSDTEARA